MNKILNITSFLGFVILIEPFDDKTPTILNPIMHFRFVFVVRNCMHLFECCIVRANLRIA